jgi:cytidylate kinase|tara:strand:+ start:12722 stop:13339 length:618 start_codon:yes stop_codon:yes gene_type:complete
MDKQIITIDGPSGSGKTTIGKLLAKDLNLTFFSSGAVYRVITKHYLDTKTINFENLDIVSTDPIEFKIDTKHYYEEDLYSPEINKKSSELAQQLEIRIIVENILKFIYESSKNGLVIEGRDMGSVVFPKSKNKIYLDSSKTLRSKRRMSQSNNIETEEDLANRDQRDSSREHSPLVIPDGAIVIENNDVTIGQVLVKIKESLVLQ